MDMAAPTCEVIYMITVYTASDDGIEWLRGADLVINCVKLGEDDAVNEVGVCLLWVVSESLVEFYQLIDCLVADERFAHKQHQVGLVDLYQLSAETGLKVMALPLCQGHNNSNGWYCIPWPEISSEVHCLAFYLLCLPAQRRSSYLGLQTTRYWM